MILTARIYERVMHAVSTTPPATSHQSKDKWESFIRLYKDTKIAKEVVSGRK